MARESFRPTPRLDRGNTIDLPTAGFPDRVSVDLDNKDPAKPYTVIETTPEPETDTGAAAAEPADDGAADDTPAASGTSVDPASVQKRVHRLKAETHRERQAREAAEARAAAAEQVIATRDAELADLRRRLEGGTAALAASMKQDREYRLADAERRLAQAHTDGDSAAIAKATSDISQAHAELTQIAARTPRPQAEPQPQAQPQAQPQRQQAPNIAPTALAWIAHNDRWFNKDPVKTKVALSVHDAVVARGITPSSPDYTRELDKGMKAMYPDHIAYGQADAGSDAGSPTPRRTNVVADGSRDTGRVTNPNQVELTSSELAIAKQLNLSPQQYAASKVKLQRGA